MTRGLVAPAPPDVPVDTVGAPLPATLEASMTIDRVTTVTGPSLERTRPAGPRAGPGCRADSARGRLAVICVQTI